MQVQQQMKLIKRRVVCIAYSTATKDGCSKNLTLDNQEKK